MHRPALPCGVFILLALVALWQARPRAAEPTPDASKRQPPAVAPLGVASCAAAACHHGNEAPGSKGSEYSTWAALDPHARAFSVLFKPESRRMHANMAAGNAELLRQGAHRNPLCLKCHGAGAGLPDAVQSDGVGCERCHGPAQKWKNSHYQRGFSGTEEGFRDLGKLTVRVETCVGCHVGDGSMEVDHDLIAAGHPRLRFEYAAYYATYPRHWDESRRSRPAASAERPASGGDLEIRSWLLGQVVAARSAAELLARRATQKSDGWPEFAEYDCAACHHDLRPRSFRTDRDLALARSGVKAPLGRLPWGAWYYALLPTLAEATNPDGNKSLVASLETIREHMAGRLPPAKKVGQEAARLAKQLGRWETALAGRRFNAAQARKLMRSLVQLEPTVRAGWDGGAEVYLGLAAVHQGWTDLDNDFKKRSPMRETLASMRKDLAAAYPQGPEARPRFDVPANYQPNALAECLKRLEKELK